MGLADILRKSEINELPDEVYDLVAEELLAGQRDEGMWVKALALSNGNEAEAKSAYIKLRAARIVAGRDKQREQQEKERERQRAEHAEAAGTDGGSGGAGFLLVFVLLMVVVMVVYGVRALL